MEKTKQDEKELPVQVKEKVEEEEVIVSPKKTFKATEVTDWNKLPEGTVVVDEAKQV